MNEIQGKALCSLLTIIVVLLFVFVFYRVYQTLVKAEEHMTNERDMVKSTESHIISSIRNTLTPENETKLNELKQKLEESQMNSIVNMTNEKEKMALQEEEAFHNNMIQKLEPFGNDEETDLHTKIDRMQELIREVQDKSVMSKKGFGDIYSATVTLGSTDVSKKVNLLLQEYTINGNSTDLYIIPETRVDKYTLMCEKTIDKNIKLEPCSFNKNIDEMKPFLYKLDEVKDETTDETTEEITGHKILLFNDETYRLVAETSGDGHTIKLMNSVLSGGTQFDTFTLKKI